MDSTTEVITISSDDDEPTVDTDKPIIRLFHNLVDNYNKPEIVLMEPLLCDIFDKEFAINLRDIHELKREMYLTVLKEFIEDWPQLDVFLKIAVWKAKINYNELEEMLQRNYHNFKNYLKDKLDKKQLLPKAEVTKLIKEKKVNRLPLDAILNWWGVRISISKGVTDLYERNTTHQLSKVPINKNQMSQNRPLKVLSHEIEVKRCTKPIQFYTSVSQYITFVENLKSKQPSWIPLLNFVQKDLKLLPDMIAPRDMSNYRWYMNKYPYVRYLYKEVKNQNVNWRTYDLHLEETVSPMYKVFLGPLFSDVSNPKLEVECSTCSIKFTGPNLVAELKAHFEERHTDDVDWRCTNCTKTFTMANLAQSWWTHKC